MLVVSSFVFKVFYNGHFSLLDRDVSSNSLDSLQNPYHFLVARTSSPASPLPTTPSDECKYGPPGPLAQDRWANSSRQSCGSVSCFAVMGHIRDGAQLCPDFQKGKSYYGACNEKWWSTSRLPRTWMCLALLFAGHSARLPQVATICVVLRNYGLLNRLADWNNSFSLTVSQRHTMSQRVATSAACAHEWRRMFRLSTGQRGPYPGVRGRKVFSAWPPHSANSHFSKFSFSLFSSSSRISVVPISGPTQRFLSQWHTMRRRAVTVAACAPVAVNSSCCVRSNRGLGPGVRG